MQIQNRKLSRAHVNQQILASCDFYQENEDWVEKLKSSCLARKQKHTSVLLKSDEHRAQQSLMQQIDTLMDALNSFAVLFNQDADYESFLTVTLPVLETDYSRKDASISERMRPSYRGRISSRNWSLVVASHMHSIEISLMPANCLLDNSV